MLEPNLRGYQTEAIQSLRKGVAQKVKRQVLMSPTGCHAKGTAILDMYGRPVPVETLKEGDYVMGPDSQPRKILALHQGVDEMFKIIPKKGKPFVVNGNHVLSVKVTNDGSKQAGKIENVTVRQWLASSKTFKHTRKLYRTGIHLPDRAVGLDPYLLGVLLGDGSIVKGCRFDNPDKEILDAVTKICDSVGWGVTHYKAQGDRCPSFGITKGMAQRSLIELLIGYGLMGTRSGTKFIPPVYLFNSRRVRLEILAGLIDTDGHYDGTYDYISKSKQLAEDVAYLCRSLGLAAYIKECTKGYPGFSGQYFRVCISGDLDMIPCRVERKKAKPRAQVKDALVTGFSVEPVGEGEYYGFECDGDHLYVMGDFTVTHNSGKTEIAMAVIYGAVLKGKRVVFLCNRINLVNQASKRFYRAGISHGIIQGQNTRQTDKQVIVASIQTVAKRAMPECDLLVVDECFSGDTLVATPMGLRRIDLVRCGDVVYNPTGLGVVEKIFSKSSDDIYKLEFDDGSTIECTGSHPCFTFGGWKQARELAVNENLFSIKGVSLLWQFVQTLDKEGRFGGDNILPIGEELEQARMLLRVLCEEICQSNEQSPNSSKIEGEVAGNKAQTYQTWRERAIATLGSAGASSCSGGGVGVGSGSSNESSESRWMWLSDLLQGGHSAQGEDDSNRIGWVEPHISGTEGAGSEENRAAYFPRLVSIQAVKRASPTPVFNLHISGHPSYFANGKLVHNCHGVAGSAEYRKVIFANKDKPIIGLTATPWSKGMSKRYPELDNQPLFEKMVVATTIGELITQGFLVDADIYAPEEPDMSGFKLKKNSFGELDYSDTDVGKAVDKPKLIGGIVEHWLKLAKDTPTVCFASNISHSKHIVEEFRAAGVQAEHIDCYTDEFERASILKRVESGETMVISNVGILTEGWDFPACKTMILARPTRSLIRYIQMIGRVLRPHESKQRALVLDHSGTVQRLGFPTDDFPRELDDGKARENKAQEKKELLPTVCQQCKFVKPRRSPVCPNCGHVNHTPTVEVEPGELKKLEKGEKQVTMADKQAWWGSFLHMAHEKGKSRSWALAQYKQKFGVWPKGLTENAQEPVEGVRSWVKSRQIAYANSMKPGGANNWK